MSHKLWFISVQFLCSMFLFRHIIKRIKNKQNSRRIMVYDQEKMTTNDILDKIVLKECSENVARD